ncbi:NAD(P)/FAD-dependent oxidoreductase [Neobacillus sp. PS2-9]|uniref:flavin-containing monooxygenase n=1 Tax=Neobacillus sp. PS2-9 TaxID=3070676 RepID=UPI0027DED085|nr:NAD(P)/FAD-dependent oxidoreductase [Neobacillus sp. PS2-9]WML57887.1 NAD(P)/FAD-dependent oxidoreductase [Neobacillus sp. PS2-9]
MIYDVVIIGAGQAGLSMGYFLKQTSLSFIILDNNKTVGDVWRKRYDSLVLFTPRSYSALPGLVVNGDPTGFPTKDEIADYLERYAQTFDLPIQFLCQVHRILKENDTYIISTTNSIIKTKKIVIATGPFHTPRIPSFAQELPQQVVQVHSSEYKNPAQLTEGSVLVVGGGNSGAQIAIELSNYHETYLSVGQRIRFLPLSIAGKSIFWWFDKLGILQANRDSFIGKKVQSQPDPIFGFELKEKLREKKITLKARTKSIQQNEIQFEDLSTINVQNVIWATGFVADYSWIDIPNLLDNSGKLKHKRGVTEIEGLYFLGLPWQHHRGSALLLGVGQDAEFLYRQIVL